MRERGLRSRQCSVTGCGHLGDVDVQGHGARPRAQAGQSARHFLGVLAGEVGQCHVRVEELDLVRARVRVRVGVRVRARDRVRVRVRVRSSTVSSLVVSRSKAAMEGRKPMSAIIVMALPQLAFSCSRLPALVRAGARARARVRVRARARARARVRVRARARARVSLALVSISSAAVGTISFAKRMTTTSKTVFTWSSGWNHRVGVRA